MTMAWREVTSGVWQRPLGENEALIKKFGMLGWRFGRDHWALNISASFKANKSKEWDVASRLRNGWIAFRFQHPSIATRLSDEDVMEYRTGSPEIIESWANETFSIVSGEATVDEIAANLKPSDVLTLFYFPRHDQVLLHTPHWRTDGPGGLQLLNAFFEATVSLRSRHPLTLSWGDEHKRLAPSVEEALNLPAEATPEITSAVQAITSAVAKMGPGVGVECIGDANTEPGATKNARLRLSESQTKGILESCERQCISVTAAVHASVAAINYLGAPPEMHGFEYKSTLRFSLRPYLPIPYNTAAYASALYTSGVIVSVPSSELWIDNVKLYHDQYSAKVSTEFVQARRHYARFMLDYLSQMPLRTAPPPSEIDVSTVEQVDEIVAAAHRGEDVSLEISSISFGIETLTRQSYVFFWIYRGQLEFNLVYNEAFHNAQSMETLVAKLPEILQTGMSLL
jgi:hypothetical protein